MDAPASPGLNILSRPVELYIYQNIFKVATRRLLPDCYFILATAIRYGTNLGHSKTTIYNETMGTVGIQT